MSLEVITAPALETRHGFFTRKGGASEGLFAGLNCGPGSADRPEAVATNRKLVAGEMGVVPEALLTLHQVHSATVVHATGPAKPGAPRPRADALVTATPGLALAVLSADCQPVLFADTHAGVIGAAHAGWKGALDGVLEATVAAMEQLGARRENIAAVIGPTISQQAYEVGPEFLARFTSAAPENARFFAPGKGDRLLFDLPGFSRTALKRAGMGHVEWTGDCTYSDRERFYSWRRTVHEEESDYGRLIATIRL